MSAKFYTLLTDIGAAKLASAAALGVPLKITQMAVGDGGGVLPTPSAQQTALVAEKRRAASICCISIRRTAARLLLSR
jgi:phage-related tail fiber protein